MPRPRPRPLATVDELLLELADGDVERMPTGRELPDRAMRSVLTFALWHVERAKRVVFPEAWDATSPAFDAVDDRVTVRVAWRHIEGIADLRAVLAEAGAAVPAGAPPTVLALDAHEADASEFELTHALYGEVEMLEFRQRAPPSREPRVEAARAAGWARTLKEHNLLPGRSLVVPDSKLGLFLREPACDALAGVEILLPTGHVELALNPFARGADAEIQYWPMWGRGEAASEWRTMLRAGDEQPDG